MIICPLCGAGDLLAGDIECEHCQQPLTDEVIRVPASSLEADLLRDLVADLPVRQPVVLGPEATVGEALSQMRDGSFGCVLIVAKGRLAGIFSERDALMRLGTAGATRHGDPLVKYMTPNPAVVSATDKIAFALHKMEVGGYRHLPVLDGEMPVNIVSIRDLLRYITQHDRDAA